ncbi:MAG: hypothetical protein ACREX4_16430 [Gammaproteobacteria bacterium]
MLPRSFASYEELLEVASFSGALEVAADPEPVYIRKLDLWDRVSLHGRVLAKKFAIVLSGSTSETMGFSIHRTPISEGRRFLLVKLDGTKHSVCRDLNKLMRLTIDGSVAPCFIEDQVHHDDRQFCELKDGYLVYELPASSRASRLIQKLDFGFWKSELSNLLMRLYFA